MGFVYDLDTPWVLPKRSTISREIQSKSAHSTRPQRAPTACHVPSAIASATPIVPRAVATAVLEEASVWLETPLPNRWIAELTERAETVYAHNRRFRSLIQRRGNAGRDWLWSFTRHWLAGLLIEHWPDLARRLPSDYFRGRPLS